MVKPPDSRPANLSPEQMHGAIRKLNRRISELHDLDLSTIQGADDARLAAISTKIEDSLASIFGEDTTDYSRYRVLPLSAVSMSFGLEIPREERLQEIANNVESAITSLQTAVEMLEEKLEDLGESESGRAQRALAETALHQAIETASGDLYRNGHYADALLRGCTALNALIQTKTGIFDADGTDLMLRVFSQNEPILRFNNLTNDHEKGEQKGMMFLYAGAMLALRNPRAHTIQVDDRQSALQCLVFISFLASRLDDVLSA